MNETSIYEYILTKNISIKEVNFEDNINNKIFYAKFKNIFVLPKLWSVITNDFFIFRDFERYLSTYKHHKEILLRQNEIKNESESILQIKGNFFLFGGENNYWHFMIDFMPRLFCLKKLSDDDIRIVIPHDLDKKFEEFIIKICNLLEINKITFLKINTNNLIHSFENLIFTSNPSIAFTSFFFHKLLRNNIKKEKKRNLYVMRGDAINRKVLNESDLIEILKKYNYDIIDCATLSIEEQIKQFSEAKNIIIPNGAAITNLLFVPDAINVIEIRSNLDGNFARKINLNNRFNLYLFEKTIKVGQKLRKDIIVDIPTIKKLVEDKKIF
jgi:capsular polysaccharide biosynthesis protein